METSDPTSLSAAPRGQRLRADLALLSVAMIWGSAFVAQRIAAPQVGVFVFNGVRFLLAALALLPVAWISRRRSPTTQGLNRNAVAGMALAGLLLWGGAALQQAGLRTTTAANAGFITGLYVVLIPLIQALLLRQRPRRMIWLAALLAAGGLFLLSTGGRLRLNPGDRLELAGAFFWALHVLLIGWLVQRMAVLPLAIGQYLACGLVSLLFGMLVDPNPWQGLSEAWGAVLYTGILSVGLGYTLQVYGQRSAPPADAAIILSSEAVFAALFGWLILAESLSAIQLSGCAIMFAGMLVAQADVLRKTN